ncbi:MAG: hypothetical protein GY870_02755 [archaeon]|nr:hypothetical protein [archaeon]
MICAVLKKHNGIQSRAAEELGINPRSLWNIVKKIDIDVSIYKP